MKRSNKKSKPTIALVANSSWSIYNFRLGLIRALLDEGHNIVVIAPRDNFTSKLVSEKITFKEIHMSNYGKNPFGDVKLCHQLYKIYKKEQVDFIFHYTIKPNIFGTIAAFFGRIPSILVITGLGQLFNFSNWVVRWITLFLYRIATLLSKEVWFLNENDRDIFKYKRIVRGKKTKVLPSEGIDTEWFRSTKERDPRPPTKFLFAGRLIKDKGVIVYAKAAKIIKSKYPDTEFELLGFIDTNNPNAISYKQIEEWQKEKILSYLGETTDIRPYFENADCLVFPSFYREGISRVLLEGAAMELPIITTNNVGCREIVQHGKNGFLCTPQDIDSLVDQIEIFLELGAQDRMVMGKLSRKKVSREFGEERVISIYAQKLKEFKVYANRSENIYIKRT